MFSKLDKTGARVKIRGVRASLARISLRIEKKVVVSGSTERFIMGISVKIREKNVPQI